MSRRRYLGLAGLATAALGVGPASASATDAYDVITVGANQRRTIRVGDGETVENLLVDCTAPGADVTFVAQGTNWTIRNVGVRGRIAGSDAFMGVADTGGNTSTIENVYLGDGAAQGHRSGLGIWVTPAHRGHLEIDRVNIQEMGDNSFYCSAPGGSGTVALRNCYSANSWVAHFRLARGTVTNCTAVNDHRRDDGRGVWAWGPGPVEVRDCDFAMNGRHYSVVAGANNRSTTVTVTDTQYDTGFNGGSRSPYGSGIDFRGGNGTNPTGAVPEGCPTTPETAAAGDGSGAPEPDGDRLTIEGVGRYRIEVDGAIIPAPDVARWVDEGDAYANDEGEGWAEWYLTGSETAWYVDGEITAVETGAYDGAQDLVFTLDGEEFDPDAYASDDA